VSVRRQDRHPLNLASRVRAKFPIFYTYSSIYSTLYFLHAYYIPTYEKRLLRVHISVYDLRTAKCPAKNGVVLFLNTIDFSRTNLLLIRPLEVIKVDSFCTNFHLSRRPLSFIANETGLELWLPSNGQVIKYV